MKTVTTDDTNAEPPLLSGDDLYNALMSNIEPDLVISQIHLLQNTYASESDSDREKRAQRYERAFAEYDRQYAAYQKSWETTFSAYKRTAMRSLEADDRKEDSAVLAKIESEIG